MFYKFFFSLLLLLLGTAVANPIYIGNPLTLEHVYPGADSHQFLQPSALINNPITMLYQYGNLEQAGALSKALLTSHLGTQKSGGLSVLHQPSALAIASPHIFNPASIYAIKMTKGMELPEKTIAGALVKQVPKVSKLPIAVSTYSPKSLELSSLAQSGILEAGLSGSRVLPGKSFINNLGLTLGY